MHQDFTRRGVLLAGGAAKLFNRRLVPGADVMMAPDTTFWPGGARLAVSFSMMSEAGGQPISGAGGVIPDPIVNGLPDLPTNAFFEYGVLKAFHASWIYSTDTGSNSPPS